jgi:hypothetical protein
MKAIKVTAIILLFLIIIPLVIMIPMYIAFGPSDSLNTLGVLVGFGSGAVGGMIVSDMTT